MSSFIVRYALFLLLSLLLTTRINAVDRDPLGVYGPATHDQSGTGSNRVSICPGPQPDQALSLSSVIEQTLCRHPQSREVWANARSQAALLGAAKGAWLPTANAKLAAERVSAEGADFNRQTATVTLSWLLYDFGAREAAEAAARHAYEAALATGDYTLQALLSGAMQAFFSAVASQAAVTAALESERAAGMAAEAADTRYRVGVATPADRLQAKTALSQAVLNRVRAEGTLRTASGVLANAMGLDAQQSVRLPVNELPPVNAEFVRDVDALVEQARRERADLRAADAQWRAAARTSDKFAADGRPTLSVGVTPNWQRVGPLETQGSTFGLSLNVPLFSGYDTLYKTQSAQALAEAKQAQRDRLASQIALDVWRAYQALRTAGQAVGASRDLLASATASEDMALGRYRAGVGSILDLLNAQSALAAARAQDIQAVYDWQSARVALALALGTLNAKTASDRLLEN